MRAAVLVQPEIPENTGFIARLCSNFGLKLRVVKPEFNLSEARNTASKAQDKLRETRIYGSVEDAVEDLEFVVGTKPGKGVEISSLEPRRNTSVMIGRESSGLSKKELELCDAVTHIGTSEYESINQSHAAAILFYQMGDTEEQGMNQKQKQRLEQLIRDTTLKQALMRANPSKREADRILGELEQGDWS